jgi:hypothetical protein
VVGSCKYGDKPVGSGATELVSYLIPNIVVNYTRMSYFISL